LVFVEGVDGLAEGDLAEQGEGAVERAAIVAAGDEDAAAEGLEREAVGGNFGGGADDDGGLAGDGGREAEGATGHAADAAEEFRLRARDDGRVAERDGDGGEARRRGDGRVAEPGVAAGLGLEAAEGKEKAEN